eukprot:CAMPEP_0169207250 /NCGR_PEP_ID=MMETSP1016-20121227/13482_1 /TAXON_ID=342587 /ORGANISM="Karlodinium micrum, Strain CCMP2283" /LENGTH=130 /DNA_ID=CAMNT_0009284513 /DNA_START=230 /DNA_END=622 /DNA_ORIENTATION=-
MSLSMVTIFKGNVLSGISPLVGTTMAEHVGEVMVVEVHTIGIAVIVLPIRLVVHENFHGLSAMLKPDHEQDGGNRYEHHEQLYTCRHKRVHEVLDHLAERNCLPTVLSVEVLLWIYGRIMDAADDPWWTV